MLVAIGTGGDVYPIVGVGRALQERGHEVHVASSPEHQGFVERSNLRFHELKGIPGTTNAAEVYHPTRGMRVVAERLLLPAVRPVYELLAALDPAEWTVIASPCSFGARIAQEKLGFWTTTYLVTPFFLRSVRRMPITPGIACPQWAPLPVRRAFFGAVSRMWDKTLAPELNRTRESVGLAHVKNIWYQWCLSPDRVIGLFPEWFAPNPGDWPAQFVHGGFTVFDQGVSAEIPRELIEPGDPIVVFAAGSAGHAASAFFHNAVSASEGQPWRAVLLTGTSSCWRAPSLPANVYHFDYIPLSRLLPLSSAIVHHGGLGTVSLALAACVPQIAVPLGHDQFDNAARIEQMGVGRSVLNSGNVPLRLRSAVQELLQDRSWPARYRRFQRNAAVEESLSRVCEQIESDNQERKVRHSA